MLFFDHRSDARGAPAWLPDAERVRRGAMIALRPRRGSIVRGALVEAEHEDGMECVVLTRTGKEVRARALPSVRDAMRGEDVRRHNQPLGVFTYGTLMRAQRSHAAIAKHASHIAAAYTIGRLFDLGDYPGLLSGSRRVYGELVVLEDPRAALRELDAYEEFLGYGAPGSLYRRVVVSVTSEDRGTSAWAYRYLGPTRDLPLITSGDWRCR